MTSRTNSSAHRPGAFADARAQAELDILKLRTRAARTVAGQAINDDDRTRLLSMLGLDDMTAHPDANRPSEPEPVSPQKIELGLAEYVQAVAAQLGIPSEATGFESSDTITAYLGLPDRCSDYPNRDLMLVWNERDGWLVAVETHPMEPAKVIGYLGGHDILPHPSTVATFVSHLLSGHRASRYPRTIRRSPPRTWPCSWHGTAHHSPAPRPPATGSTGSCSPRPPPGPTSPLAGPAGFVLGEQPPVVCSAGDRNTDVSAVTTTTQTMLTERLTLRPWRVDDAPAALDVYGHAEVTRWLSPDMDLVPDLAAMRLLLQQWIAEDARLAAPAGRWAIQRNDDDRVIGGAVLLPLPPGNEDLEIGWQLHPDVWGNGYASETTHALATWAFSRDIYELFAVVRPGNARAAATVRHNGMHWVGETTKYFDTDLQVFRLRVADLDRSAPAGHHPPNLTRD